MNALKNALELYSDFDKSSYNEATYYQMSPLMFQKVNEKIPAKCANQRALMMYLICQQHNGSFHLSEGAICAALGGITHSAYVEARKGLIERGLIVYDPFKSITVSFAELMA